MSSCLHGALSGPHSSTRLGSSIRYGAMPQCRAPRSGAIPIMHSLHKPHRLARPLHAVNSDQPEDAAESTATERELLIEQVRVISDCRANGTCVHPLELHAPMCKALCSAGYFPCSTLQMVRKKGPKKQAGSKETRSSSSQPASPQQAPPSAPASVIESVLLRLLVGIFTVAILEGLALAASVSGWNHVTPRVFAADLTG